MAVGSIAHLRFQVKHAGLPVVYGAQRGYGILDLPGFDATDPTGFRIKGSRYELSLVEGDWSGLTEDTTITVDATKALNLPSVLRAKTDFTIKDIGNAGTNGLRRITIVTGVDSAVTPPGSNVPGSGGSGGVFGGGAVFG